MGLFNKVISNESNYEDLLDQVLFTVPGTNNQITWADSVEGILVTGATGSGKSSGPGRHIALAMLKSGFGFCVLCAKPDERIRWERYARESGREDDLVIFNKDSGLCFNFLKYEMERRGEGSGEIINMINSIINLNEQLRIYTAGEGGKGEEKYWDNGLRRLISRTISLLRLAGEEISIWNMRNLITHSFTEEEANLYSQLKRIINSTEKIDFDKRQEAKIDLELWAQNNYFVRLIEKIKSNEIKLDIDEYDLALNYWTKEFPRLAEKSRGIFVESFMGVIEPFLNKGILKEQFSGGLDEVLLPENIITQRKIVIIDFPLKEFGISGVFASIIYKSTFQAAMERRNIENEPNPIPVSLWIDEFQCYVNPSVDALFQTTARSSWVSTVYITQNINNLYFVMGNNHPVARTKSLLGNLNLKIFASNADFETNRWASEMIGKHLIDVQSVSFDKNMEISKSKRQQMEYRVTPDHFTTLKTGRKKNKYIVEAIVFKAGNIWGKEKENYALVEFNQRGS